MSKINFKDFIKKIEKPWQPLDIVYVNDTALRMAKIDGAYEWHTHQNEDEFFYVLKGEIFIDLEKEAVHLKEQEGFLVKKGLRHRSRSEKPAWILLVEPTATKTLGDKIGKK
ncbi:MAG: cupin domain-containing protein [candidate division WOR-3 bacterium]